MSYNPTLGRWAQRDPEGYIDGSNLYEFVRSNPGKWTDPTGTHVNSTVDKDNCTITFTLNIMIKNKGGFPWFAMESIASQIKQGIEDNWNEVGSQGVDGCKVRFEANVTVGRWWEGGENTIGIVRGPHKGVVHGDRRSGEWPSVFFYRLTDRPLDAILRKKYAHEAGHLMGLNDEYDKVAGGTRARPGHEDTMMAEEEQVTSDEIRRIMAAQGVECPCKCK